MKPQPHIKTEGTSKFQIGEIKNNTVHYDFEKIKTYLNIKGHSLFGKSFKIYKEDAEDIKVEFDDTISDVDKLKETTGFQEEE